MATALRLPVLALDTSGAPISVAILTRDGPPLELASAVRAGAALHGLLDEALRRTGLEPKALGGVVAVRGPGSFTGLRVGLASAAGLALAGSLAAAGVETARAVALAAAVRGRVAVVLDGGQGRVFVSVVDASAGDARTEMGPVDVEPEEACGLVAEVGRGLLRGEPPAAAALLRAGCVAWDGALAAAAGRLALNDEPDGAGLQALYARAPAIRPAAG